MPEQHYLPTALSRLRQNGRPIRISEFEAQLERAVKESREKKAESGSEHPHVNVSEVVRLMVHYKLAHRVNGSYMTLTPKALEQVKSPRHTPHVEVPFYLKEYENSVRGIRHFVEDIRCEIKELFKHYRAPEAPTK